MQSEWQAQTVMLMREEISASSDDEGGHLQEAGLQLDIEGRQDPGEGEGRALGWGGGRQSLGWSSWQVGSPWLLVRSGATAWRKGVMVLMTWAGSMKTMCPTHTRVAALTAKDV